MKIHVGEAWTVGVVRFCFGSVLDQAVDLIGRDGKHVTDHHLKR